MRRNLNHEETLWKSSDWVNRVDFVVVVVVVDFDDFDASPTIPNSYLTPPSSPLRTTSVYHHPHLTLDYSLHHHSPHPSHQGSPKKHDEANDPSRVHSKSCYPGTPHPIHQTSDCSSPVVDVVAVVVVADVVVEHYFDCDSVVQKSTHSSPTNPSACSNSVEATHQPSFQTVLLKTRPSCSMKRSLIQLVKVCLPPRIRNTNASTDSDSDLKGTRWWNL
jgi:hypothetical protein